MGGVKRLPGYGWMMVAMGLLGLDFSLKASTEMMQELLARMARRSNPIRNTYLNHARSRLFGEQVKQAATDLDRLDPLIRQATELLAAGQSEEALSQFLAWDKLAKEVSPGLADHNQYLLQFHVALSHLRIGEQENCVENHTSASCIFPIQPEGAHRLTRGSESAVSVLELALRQFPDDLAMRWLLNLAYMTLGGYPDEVPEDWLIPESFWASEVAIEPFPEVAAPAGLDVNALAGGVVADDLNGDGLLDILVTSWGLEDPPHYLENQGNGQFKDKTQEAGLQHLPGGLNMVSADYDNDGDVDIFVLRGAWLGSEGRLPNSLWQNNGRGQFEDVTHESGLLSMHPTQTAVWADFNNDGWLDLFVGNESSNRERHRCELFMSQGDGTFREVSRECGLQINAYVKGTAVSDLDHDGWLDLFISNEHGPNRLFRNQGSQPSKPGLVSFVDQSNSTGIGEPVHSFPCWFFDADQDGWDDLFVSGYRIKEVGEVIADYLGMPHNASKAKFYRNTGLGTFQDASASFGLDKVLHAMGSNYGDLNNDGFPDFYLGTGDPDLSTLIPNRMFLNQQGQRFGEVTHSGGLGHLQKGHGIAFADLDNDGDQDVYANMGGAVEGDAYRNALFLNPGFDNRWLKLSLQGIQSNRMGLGSRIEVKTLQEDGTKRSIYRAMGTGGSFGASPLRLELGLGKAKAIEGVVIHWHGSGLVQDVEGIQVDTWVTVTEGDPQPLSRPLKGFEMTQAVSPHVH